MDQPKTNVAHISRILTLIAILLLLLDVVYGWYLYQQYTQVKLMGQLSESMLQNQVETTKVGDDTDAEALQKILDGLEGVGPVVPESGPVDVTSLEAVQPQTGAVVIDPESLVDVPPLQWPEAIQ